jgi:WG containing repeat
MKRIQVFAITVVTLSLVIAASAQNRYFGLPFLVSIDGKYGFMDASCRMIIPAQYTEAFDFSEGLAAVKIGQKCGYIDESGTMVIPAQFAGAWYFSDGLASVKLDEQSPLWGCVDKSGRVVIRQFGIPLWFSEGLVEGYGAKNHILNVPLGYVDHAGNYTIRLDEPGTELEFLLGFSEGLARVSMEPKHADGSVGPSKYGYIDHDGKGIVPRSFTGADDFHEGLAAVTGEGGTWGLHRQDRAGQFVIPPSL